MRAVGAFCIGTNQIDLRAAMLKGVPVFNAPFSNTRSVAELVLAEIVMLMRGIPHKNAVLHRGGWVKSAAGSYEVRGKTLGIVGYGHIGTQIGAPGAMVTATGAAAIGPTGTMAMGTLPTFQLNP